MKTCEPVANLCRVHTARNRERDREREQDRDQGVMFTLHKDWDWKRNLEILFM